MSTTINLLCSPNSGEGIEPTVLNFMSSRILPPNPASSPAPGCLPSQIHLLL